MILKFSIASLRSVCSSKHEAGQRSLWFEIRISLGLYKLFLLVRFNRTCPVETNQEKQQGLKEGGVDPFRRQVRKLGINALKALAGFFGWHHRRCSFGFSRRSCVDSCFWGML